MSGTYFENCNCEVVCPCTWSGLQEEATEDRCRSLLAFRIDDGTIDGVDVSGRTFAMVIDAPKIMADGDWTLGILLDDSADDSQTEALQRVLSGQAGGPPELLQSFIGEMVGFEQVPVTLHEDDDGAHRATFGEVASVAVADIYASEDRHEPVRLANVSHPVKSDTLTLARARESRVDAFGISFAGSGTNGFAAPFDWSG